MKFTEEEIRFLIKPRVVETADLNGNRQLGAAVDLRQLGCPAAIFQKVLESRARRCAKAFAEFRSSSAAVVEIPATDFDARIAGSGLF